MPLESKLDPTIERYLAASQVVEENNLIMTMLTGIRSYIDHLEPLIIKEIKNSHHLLSIFKTYYLPGFARYTFATKDCHDRVSSYVIERGLMKFMRDIAENNFREIPKNETTVIPILALKNDLSTNLKDLALKYHPVIELNKIVSNYDIPAQLRIKQTKEKLESEELRKQIGKERSFWGWLFNLLHLSQSHGKRFIGFFDKKYAEAKTRKVIPDEKNINGMSL